MKQADCEIAKNIRKIEPHINIICTLIKTCANCKIFEHCATRMFEAAGITEDMLLNCIFNRIMECNTFNDSGMCWKINLNEGK